LYGKILSVILYLPFSFYGIHMKPRKAKIWWDDIPDTIGNVAVAVAGRVFLRKNLVKHFCSTSTWCL
jgi:hypothetical protein